MADARADLVRQWLIKAEHDLASAERLLSGEPPFADTAVFHCQQAAEKALKAYLAWNDQPLRRAHDLSLLVRECVTFDVSFAELEEAAEVLTPYGTAFRYPGEMLEPAPSEASEAVEFARRFVEHARIAIKNA